MPITDKKVKPRVKVELNPLTGEFDLITDNNWSYRTVPENKKLRIPGNMQMAHHGCFEIDGTMEVDGDLVIEE